MSKACWNTKPINYSPLFTQYPSSALPYLLCLTPPSFPILICVTLKQWNELHVYPFYDTFLKHKFVCHLCKRVKIASPRGKDSTRTELLHLFSYRMSEIWEAQPIHSSTTMLDSSEQLCIFCFTLNVVISFKDRNLTINQLL